MPQLPDSELEEYRAALRALSDSGRQSPSLEVLGPVCPHLNAAQRQLVLDSPEGSISIALPPLKVMRAFQLLAVNNGAGDVRLSTMAGRLSDSFAFQPPGGWYDDYPYMLEAVLYATDRWFSCLVPDTWREAQVVFVQDPTERSKKPPYSPVTRWVITAGLASSWESILAQTNSKVFAWDESIQVATVDTLEGLEISRGHPRSSTYCCARCGGALSVRQCLGCGFPLAPGPFRTGTVSLPPKLVEILRAAEHRFQCGPERLY